MSAVLLLYFTTVWLLSVSAQQRAIATCLTLFGMVQPASPIDDDILKTVVQLHSSANGASSIRLQSSSIDAYIDCDAQNVQVEQVGMHLHHNTVPSSQARKHGKADGKATCAVCKRCKSVSDVEISTRSDLAVSELTTEDRAIFTDIEHLHFLRISLLHSP